MELIVYPEKGANSFIDFDDADAYAQTSLYYIEWNVLTDDDKTRYLMNAYKQIIIQPGLTLPGVYLSFVIDDLLVQVVDDSGIFVVSDLQTDTEDALGCLPYAQVDLALWNLHQVNNPYIAPGSSGSTGTTDVIKKAKVGPISVEYETSSAVPVTNPSCEDECPEEFPDTVKYCLEQFGAEFIDDDVLHFQQLMFTRGC